MPICSISDLHGFNCSAPEVKRPRLIVWGSVKTEDLEFLARHLVDGVQAGHCSPILEADLAGMLFHLFISFVLCYPADIHLDTRIHGQKSGFYDIAIGDLITRNSDDRAFVAPSTLLELKMFPMSFSDQDLRKHFEILLSNDLPKLARAQTSFDTPILRAEFIFDESGFLFGTYGGKNRLTRILNERDRLDPTIHVLLCSYDDDAEEWSVSFR